MPKILQLLTIVERYNEGRISYEQAGALMRACFSEHEQARAIKLSINLLDDHEPEPVRTNKRKYARTKSDQT